MACHDAICFAYSFLGHLMAYFALLALLVIFSALLAKCIGDWREMNMEQVIERGENISLMHQHHYAEKIASLTTTNYGTCYQDLESGNCSNINNTTSSSSSSTNTNNYCATELYNSRVCVICYTEQRNSFFVPCGHFATCHLCANRIYYEESRSCPICRRFISKIRRLSDS
ncbi:hypothetical protein KSS87_009473 [Heliosperma pusillum]|nr:hypothetical protein KSS87_009473 [Heliosperma pusillum]KAH9603067.1 hypothetical protein KSS87_009473 [Heliosperma pusillum]